MKPEDYRKFVRALRVTLSEQSVDADQIEAFRILSGLSKKGYIRSTFYLGVCFDNGVGTRTNRKKAFEAFHVAALGGHPEAQHNLYQMYRDGVGTYKDINKAIAWLKKAAKGRDVEAMRDLGYCYHEGAGVKSNFNKAATLYRMAAKAGDAKAQWNLALCYRDADGVRQSSRWSRHWMNKSALNGHLSAHAYLTRNAQLRISSKTNSAP